jgi:hypothetical protein
MAAAAATLKERWVEVPDGMKGPLIFSGIIHVVLLIVAVTGLPYFKTDPKPMVSSIPVEILPIAELTTTNKKTPLVAPPAPEIKEQTKPKEAKPLPPKVEEVKPPEPPKPKQEKPKPKAKPVVPPPPDEAALEKTKEEPKPKEKPVEPEAEEKKTEDKEDTQDFTKLLKNLQDSKPVVDETLPESKEATPPTPAPPAPFSETMTMSEADALAQQLQRCWSIQAGARYAEDLVVKVRLTVSPERRTLSAVVVDTWRYSQDSYFRAAADAAIRAVHSPQCEILELPPDKYETWKDIVVTFDPTEML